MPKVTVILPSLNVSQYIRETLGSVCGQTLEDIEILCVDAGSTDGTEEIIKEYEQSDSRVHYIHSDMRSYGHQMNMGISLAKGEYIGIVETDDYVDTGMFEDLYRLARENTLDIVKSNYRYFFEGNRKDRFFIKSDLAQEFNVEYNKVFSCEDFISGKYTNDVYIWDGIYRTEYIREKGIRFNETPGASFQDWGFKFLTFLQAQRIMYVEEAYYNYRKDNLGSSTYDTRTVGFIFNEANYVLQKLGDRMLENKDLYGVIAKHIMGGHMTALDELCKWVYPDEKVRDDIIGYIPLIKRFKEDKVYTAETLGLETWKQTELLLKDPETYIKSKAIMLHAEGQIAIDFIDRCAQFEQVVIFGSGKYGKAALTFLRACGEGEKVVAFADNNPNVVGKEIYGVKVISPEDAASNYNNALFVIASPSNSTTMRKQLRGLGIEDSDVVVYNYSSSIFTCTSGINIYKAGKQ